MPDMTSFLLRCRERWSEEGANSDVQARMRELESAAETLRTLYNQALQQFSRDEQG